MISDRYRTFWPRFFAGFIDGIIFIPLAIVDAFILTPDRNLGVVVVWMIFSYLAFIIYSIYFHWKSGQTIGKKVMSIQVIDISEEKGLTFKQAVLRDGFYLVLQIILVAKVVYEIILNGSYSDAVLYVYSDFFTYLSLGWFLLEVLTMLTNNKRRAFHDMLAKTVVINKPVYQHSVYQ